MLALTCEVTFHSSFTKTPSLTTGSAKCEHFNLAQPAAVLVELCLEDGPRNVGWKSCPVEQRVRRLMSWPCLGKHSPSLKHFNECSVTVELVRCGLMRNCWPREGFTGKRRETVPCPHMLTEVFRRLQESKVEPTKMGFRRSSEDRECQGETRTVDSDSRTERRVYPSTSSGMESAPDEKKLQERHL